MDIALQPSLPFLCMSDYSIPNWEVTFYIGNYGWQVYFPLLGSVQWAMQIVAPRAI